MSDRLPLEGVRVIDMTHRLAGPTLSMFLADWGADIIKVERWQRMDAWRGFISVDHDKSGKQLWEARGKCGAGGSALASTSKSVPREPFQQGIPPLSNDARQ